jgi:hypothetical protein
LVEISGQALEEVVIAAAAAAAEGEEDLQSGNLAEEFGHTVGREDQYMTALPAVVENPQVGLAWDNLYTAAAAEAAQSRWFAV